MQPIGLNVYDTAATALAVSATAATAVSPSATASSVSERAAVSQVAWASSEGNRRRGGQEANARLCHRLPTTYILCPAVRACCVFGDCEEQK
jgi:hypothetical protein